MDAAFLRLRLSPQGQAELDKQQVLLLLSHCKLQLRQQPRAVRACRFETQRVIRAQAEVTETDMKPFEPICIIFVFVISQLDMAQPRSPTQPITSAARFSPSPRRSLAQIAQDSQGTADASPHGALTSHPLPDVQVGAASPPHSLLHSNSKLSFSTSLPSSLLHVYKLHCCTGFVLPGIYTFS